MSDDTPTRYPLCWPPQQPRVPRYERRYGAFKVTFAQARADLIYELEMLGATDIILSTNLVARGDGLPRAVQRAPDDPAVAVYFVRDESPAAMGCDLYRDVRSNTRALYHCVKALRTIQRHGAPAILDQAFTGFKALPAPGQTTGENWWAVLNVAPGAPFNVVKAAYRAKVAEAHPDRGGSDDAFRRIQDAWRRALDTVFHPSAR